MQSQMNVAFLGSGRCFHTNDWFRSTCELLGVHVPYITDNYEGDGLPTILKDGDDVRELLIIDKVLATRASTFGHRWRNLVKLLLVPVQIFLLRRHLAKMNRPFLLAHSTYYAFIASFTNAPYAAIPQGSEVLVRPKAKFYRWFLRRSLEKANFITVDSESMKRSIGDLTTTPVFIVQNGINVRAVRAHRVPVRELVMSIRAISANYRILEIISGRNAASPDTALTMTFPFTEANYFKAVSEAVGKQDVLLGCVDKEELYGLMGRANCILSIPGSDSSPRSVYEAIFAGAAALCAPSQYIEALPACMRARVVVVDIAEEGWFSRAVARAEEIVRTDYVPSEEALLAFDQVKSMAKCLELVRQFDARQAA